ncbi:helix-turn-helix transcriptional regulator [Kitasatospora indigofera]|uniref:helix-turn-helix transcriptional regulator n=1 Tax=Kitasatospora indigofera TaxID=67307 RepID=UPI0036CC8939
MQSTAYYLTPPAEVHALGLAVTGVGRIVGQCSTRVDRALPGYAGVLVTEGAGSLALRGAPGRHAVPAGSFFWLPPGVPHTYGPTPGTWSEYWVLFEGPATGRYEDLGYLAAGPAPVEPADPAGTRAALDKLLQLGSGPESLSSHVAAAATLQVLIAAVGTPHAAPRLPADASLDIGRRALAVLARDAAGPVSIGAVARELSVSRDTLATQVRRLTGSTPTDHLTRLRLNRAKGLLAFTDRSIADVARAVGYPDPAYFTRAFTRRIGVSPSTFRQQQRT